MKLGKEARDQAAHFAAAFAVLAIASLLRVQFKLLAGAFLGLALGIVREVTEGGNVLSDGSLLDLVFWTLGGAAAGAVWGLIKRRGEYR